MAWRVGHLGRSNLAGFTERRFGGPQPPSLAATVDEVPDFLTACYGPWRQGIGRLDEAQWATPLGPTFGPHAGSSTLDLAFHVFDELVHHGAEVALLRDLYWSR
jgi:hypothetical protein